MRYFSRFFGVVSLFVCSTCAFSNTKSIALQVSTDVIKTQLTRTDTFYYEDFESLAHGWTFVDLTDVPGMWHPDTFQAYEGSGKSWWMGDPTLGGYLNHWYQVLDSPEIALPSGTCILSFMMNRAVENLGGDPPYNGWDGVNVRISTDGGTNWEVLLNPTPAYNSTSMYSFGKEHGEGPNVPGWGGSSSGWVEVTFDISAYANDTVRIRWAFASDPATCTSDDAGLFGVQIDDIDVAGVFTNDGEDTVGFTRTSEASIGGNLWHITEDAGCPSPTKVCWCGDINTGTYGPNMNNACVSPLITLPVADTITVQFWLRGGFHDPDTFPDNDYFGTELSPDTGRNWYAFSNPTGDPLDTNFVWPLPPYTAWSLLNPVDISMYAGKSLLFRIWLDSDGDAPGDSSEGLFIDDFYLCAVGAGVEEDNNEVKSFKLWQSSPNPARNKTYIRFSLSKSSNVSLRIYSVSGQLVRTLVNEPMNAGVNSIMWDTRNSDGKLMPGGIYFYELKVGALKKTNKLILLR